MLWTMINELPTISKTVCGNCNPQPWEKQAALMIRCAKPYKGCML